MWFSCSLGGNWNDPPVPSCWKSTIEHGNGSNSHHGHFICLKLCRCRGDKQQKYPMTQIVERGHRQERCRHQHCSKMTSWILHSVTISADLYTIYLLYVVCNGALLSNLSSLIYSVFLLLSCSCLWSILVQCDRGDQPLAANCPRSVNTDTGEDGNYFFCRYI